VFIHTEDYDARKIFTCPKQVRLARLIRPMALPQIERRSAVCFARGERGIWQRRFWKHMIVDGADYAAQYGYRLLRPMYCNLSGYS
jgi:putative transposase